LNKLIINGFRAFSPDEPKTLKFDGENAVILGDNGTGKSSVLAAIEFLLTGGMTHLNGPGTNDISVQDHAPHISAEQDECFVIGEFESVNGNLGSFKRKASTPSNLEKLSGNIKKEDIKISQWDADHLVLTRGQLLSFIESSAKKRGDKLSKLLNLSGISNRSRGFKKIQSNLKDKVNICKEIIEREFGEIKEILDIELNYPEDFQEPWAIISEINENLNRLRISPINQIDELDETLQSINLSLEPEKIDYFYKESMQRNLKRVKIWINKNNEIIEKKLNDLATDLGELEAYSHVNLRLV